MRGDGSGYIILLCIGLAITIVVAWSSSSNLARERQENTKLRSDLSNLRKEFADFQKKGANEVSAMRQAFAQADAKQKFVIEGLTKILEQRKSQFPWLAAAIADFSVLGAELDARRLETKRHPAKKSADEIREHSLRRREAEKNLKIQKYRVEYYEWLFPWIADYVGDDVPDYVVDQSGDGPSSSIDPASEWLSKSEYEKLSSVEKYQKALDNWSRRRKSNWEIGRDYERYVGYLYETMGYEVEFRGAIDGFEDMGRDVIARRGPEIVVIQCKYWAARKEIREKHVFQLFGSALEYAFKLGGLRSGVQKSFFDDPTKIPGIKPVIYTSTHLSPVARDVANRLSVEFNELAKIPDYPQIKCNVSMRDGQKIYHLPFDQQYDRVKILRPPEKYVYSVADAESQGFRRAWRWHPSSP